MTQPLPVDRLRSLLALQGIIGHYAGRSSGQSEISARNEISKQYSSNGYRPPQWGRAQNSGDYSSMVYMSSEDSEGRVTQYFFDAVFNTQHESQRQITEHPVQWGAAITDHSYQLPAYVNLQIGMSDSMDQFTTDNSYSYLSTIGKGKSVNAYEAFFQLQEMGAPLTLVTRLKRYTNMLIQGINTNDDSTTANALKCTITFKEIFIGQTSTIAKSLFPEASAEDIRKKIATTSDPKMRETLLSMMTGGGQTYYFPR